MTTKYLLHIFAYDETLEYDSKEERDSDADYAFRVQGKLVQCDEEEAEEECM